jgi:L-alanine-DL-glutamate epimerase-like enolase superfamily enzyme
MSLQLSYCRYRLVFRHPFGTAHGLRDGTPSVFIRAEEQGSVGYGEATLPPYLPETQESVIQRITSFWDSSSGSALDRLDQLALDRTFFLRDPSARAALNMALLDLQLKLVKHTGIQLDNTSCLKSCVTLKTVGIGRLEDVAAKLADTIGAKAIKVKLGSSDDRQTLERIKELDHRALFLDANQAFGSVQEALDRINWAGKDRVIGMEQPFPKDRNDLHAELMQCTEVPVYGDESIQGLDQLETAAEAFSGVNVKLMKCGGLDQAANLIDRAQELGLRIMLGSMSESSLGCTAMGWFAGRADVVDLDGPWLITNDPFKGMDLVDGQLVMPDRPGLGAELKADLRWTPFGA